jgi:hypothetical protein
LLKVLELPSCDGDGPHQFPNFEYLSPLGQSKIDKQAFNLVYLKDIFERVLDRGHTKEKENPCN